MTPPAPDKTSSASAPTRPGSSCGQPSDTAFDPNEASQSQLPAFGLLVAIGFKPLSHDDVWTLRGERLNNVILDSILVEQSLRINRFEYRGKVREFDRCDAEEAVRRLKPDSGRGRNLRAVNQEVYDTLVLGTTIAKNVGRGSKSYSFHFVDWENPANNVYHVTAEMTVRRTGSQKTRRPDLVAFVNGIPFVVVENKAPGTAVKDAVRQLLGYQREDNIPQLFHFAQLVMAMNRQEAKYGTVATPWKFWQTWDEAEDNEDALTEAVGGASWGTDSSRGRSASAVREEIAHYMPALADRPQLIDAFATAEGRTITSQDRAIYSLCRPKRLLDLVRWFTVFEGGHRKIARHQQYFAVRRALDCVKQFDAEGRRQGGIVWHTQGSGKSLTMVMLARALALDPDISNPRIVIVTDRVDLDIQIRDTFKSCDQQPVRATTGKHLARLIRDKAPLVTTIVNKFDTALGDDAIADSDPNIFVLVDESHRSHTGRYGGHGQLAVKMRRVLPRACYLGFTGTPLLKREKNTFGTFGTLIHRYAIDEAVEDGAVVPLLYESRMVNREVANKTLDGWFDRLADGLNERQEADLKRKYSAMNALSQTSQTIRAIAFDISEHYRRNWQGTGFKAQLVAPSKAAAVRYRDALDGLGDVTSEVVISEPDDFEGDEELDRDSKSVVRRFWNEMMDRFGTEREYNRQLVEAFKGPGEPEILIVVSKLLTGFDAPRNTVLYVCKTLREHNLLQAIARVNRLFEDGEEKKQFGFIVDYEGLLVDLDKALTAYTALQGYDEEDLAGAVRDVREAIRQLPDKHAALWDLFREINRSDMEAFEQALREKADRDEFYERLRAFGRCLHIAMSSAKFASEFDEAYIDEMKDDFRRFSKLRQAVGLRYQDRVDIAAFESKIRNLLDDHVTAHPVETIIEPVNIHHAGVLAAMVGDNSVSAASRADRITSATRRTITEKMEEDPAFYLRFSEMLDETIAEYRKKRLSELEYLERVKELAEGVRERRRDRAVPALIADDSDAQAYFGLFDGKLNFENGEAVDRDRAAEVAKRVTELIQEHRIVDIWSNESAVNELRNALDDYFYDDVRAKMKVDLPESKMSAMQTEILRIAEARSRA